jgi:hypothetical protein
MLSLLKQEIIHEQFNATTGQITRTNRAAKLIATDANVGKPCITDQRIIDR